MNNNEIPQSVLNLAKRLHAMTRPYDGRIIVNVTFLTNGDGVPVAWSKPKVIPLEPRLDMEINPLEEGLSQDKLQRMLEIIAFYG